jgi:hypothetical protein
VFPVILKNFSTTTSMIRSDLIARLAELHPQLQIKDAELAVKVIVALLKNEWIKRHVG